MKLNVARLGLVMLLVSAGCKGEVEEAMADAKEAQKKALEAAKLAKKAADIAQKAAVEAGEAGEAAGEAGEAMGDGKINPQNPQEALAQLQKAIQKNTSNVEPVDFRALKKMLPDEINGMKRTDASGEKAGAMGMKIAQAEGKFKGEDGASARLKIIDMGSMKGFAAMAATGWAMAEIDRESDTGYEKTTKIDGHKAYEKWDGKRERGEVKLIIGDRFMVELTARKTPMKAIKKTIDGLPLDDLEAMKNQGVKK